MTRRRNRPLLKKTQVWFDRTVEGYGRWLDWVLDRQQLTLSVALGTLVFTAVLYIVIPKGFFPVQDTGAIQGTPKRRKASPTRPWRKSSRNWPPSC